MDTINDFFGKLGAIYGRLNLIAKPMQIYKCDETGVSVVLKPGKVVAEMGRHKVYAVTSAEKGKTHTILTCVSVSSHVLPPMMIFPRNKHLLLIFMKVLLHKRFLPIVPMVGLMMIFSCSGLSSFWQIFHQFGQCCSLWMGMELTCQLS